MKHRHLYWVIFSEFVLGVTKEDREWVQGVITNTKDPLAFSVGATAMYRRSRIIKLLHRDDVSIVDHIPGWWVHILPANS